MTQNILDRANYVVTLQLRSLGFYDCRVQAIHTRLVPFGRYYGYQLYGSSSEIHIPCISLSRIAHIWNRGFCSLRDVLRHEFGHAIADTHRGLFRSHFFSSAFEGAHNWEVVRAYDPEHHLSEYAATSPAEDFAETFMLYIKHRGRLSDRLASAPIQRKWNFVRRLGIALDRGLRRF